MFFLVSDKYEALLTLLTSTQLTTLIIVFIALADCCFCFGLSVSLEYFIYSASCWARYCIYSARDIEPSTVFLVPPHSYSYYSKVWWNMHLPKSAFLSSRRYLLYPISHSLPTVAWSAVRSKMAVLQLWRVGLQATASVDITAVTIRTVERHWWWRSANSYDFHWFAKFDFDLEDIHTKNLFKIPDQLLRL